MHTVARNRFTTVKTEGAILPADLLQRISEGSGLEGLTPETYHLAPNERLNEAINRAWNRCLGAWESFDEQRRRLPESDRGTTLTRERWLLILFQELGYGRLQTARGLEAGGASYPISHRWGHTPIHLVSFRQDLDRRGEIVGATRRSPHSLVQEFLNRSDDALWGMVSNGLRLRVLRDNASLTRQAYVEFDLEAMMEGEVYADFALLWLVCHQSRIEAERPADCWLERWSKAAAEQGARALDALRDGVKEAISALGRGFLTHRANQTLRARLKSGDLTTQAYYRQLLRLVYRLIFLFVAEDRDLLLLPDAPEEARRRYSDFYSVRRLREMAETLRGGPHPDGYRGLRLVFKLLREGYPPLALPALGSFLFSPRATPDLDEAELANEALLDAIRALAFTVEGRVRRPVDYRNLGSEELGSVYESLLELHPRLNVDAATFDLAGAAGSERKSTGSYYTPASLIASLLDSALEPVVEERLKAARKSGKDAEQALLEIKVVDPACGSGHFLVAAAHRLAQHLARVRTGDDEPGPGALRAALRDVVRHCIYGVDANEMAVELCKVALWMESLEPGKPLSFLEHNIQCGNSLIGVGPGMTIGEIPDEAFQALEGDDRATATALRRRNRRERGAKSDGAGQLGLRWEVTVIGSLEDLASRRAEQLARLEALPEEEIAQVQAKAEAYAAYRESEAYIRGRLEHDLWTAAFFWPIPKGDAETMPAPTQQELIRLRDRRNLTPPDAELVRRVRALAERHNFFHWELAFPEVFQREQGGFDVVLGNPPWEHLELKEKEWFAARRPEIANAPNAAARRRMIAVLADENPALYAAFLADRRGADAESYFIRNSGRFPLCGRGRVNTYAVFAETSRALQSATGRAGIIVPSGIATDDTTKYFFQDLMDRRSLVSLYDFENRAGLFPAVHSRMKFCLLTLTGAARPATRGAEFSFCAHSVADLDDPERRFTLTAEEIALLNPNTRTCPIFRSKRDAELTKAIYRRVPVLIEEGPPEKNPWGISFKQGLFNMASDSGLFRTREQLESEGWRLEGNRFVCGGEQYLPLYEAKMIHHFDHRWATYEGLETRDLTLAEKNDPAFLALPRYWVAWQEIVPRIAQVPGALLEAYRLGDPRLVSQALASWIAGYHANRGNQEAADSLLNRLFNSHFGSVFSEVMDMLVASIKTAKLEQRYPITDEDVELIRGWQRDDILDLARTLIEARCPKWLLGWRDITNATNERTVIASVLPQVGVGHTNPLMFISPAIAWGLPGLQANLSSIAFDYAARQKIGGTHLTYNYLNQLPVLPPETYAQPCPWASHAPRDGQDGSHLAYHAFLLPRILELAYTAWDLAPFVRDCGYDGPPFRWDEARRFLLRCELDAAFFHLYGIGRDDVDYIMETFPIVKRKDEEAHGEYRTKRVILEIYDAMQRAMETGEPYRTLLDPPPADPRVAHPEPVKQPEWVAPGPADAVAAESLPTAPVAPAVAVERSVRRSPATPRAAPTPKRAPSSGSSGTRLSLSAPITVRELAARLGTTPVAVIKALMTQGVFATIDQVLDVETARRVAAMISPD